MLLTDIFFPPPGILEEITGKDEILDIEGLEKA